MAKFTVLPSNLSSKEIAILDENSHSNGELEHVRQIHFDTSDPHTVIKWHFSKNTIQNDRDGKPGTADDRDGDLYRDLGRRSIEIFNRAFEIITEEYCLSKGEEKGCKTIQLELLEEGDKELGDLRYNLLNLPKSAHSRSYGIAPSFVRPDTGEIIGTSANVFIGMKVAKTVVEKYIWHELEKKEKILAFIENCNGEGSNPDKCKNSLFNSQEHAVSSYLKSKIEARCGGVLDFIIKKTATGKKRRA